MNVLFERIAAFPVWRLTGLFALGAALVASAEGTPPPYVVTDLGDTYQVSGFQSKIVNDQGQVIGNQVLGNAFLYTSGSWNQLGTLNTTGTTNNATAAQGLNNAGLVVGQSDTGGANSNTLRQRDGFFQAGVSGSFTALSLVSGSNQDSTAVAFGCNDLGVTVGDVYQYSTGRRSTFLYAPGTGILSNTNDNIRSFAIDRFGNVLGSEDSLIPQAALNDVPLPASTSGFVPHAINNSGQILLSVDNTSPLIAGWGLIYNFTTNKSTYLKNLSLKSTGYTTFLDINDTGAVVGRGSDATSNPHAVLYTAATGLTSLDALGLTVSGTIPVTLTEAEGINNHGQIVCTGYTTVPTDLHAYLLTPTTPSVPALAATYDGLATVGGSNAGVVSITIGKTNIASVTLRTPAATYSFKAPLTSGSFSGAIPLKSGILNVAFQSNASNQIVSGTIAGAATYSFSALRQVAFGISAGKYTALLQLSGSSDPSLPQGIGYGKMTVAATGMVTITGQLGDGSIYTVATKLHYDGSWTFYAPLYVKTAQPGLIAGSMVLNRTALDSDSAGALDWRKPGSFDTSVAFKAAIFHAAPKAQLLRFTDLTSGTASFAISGGGVTLPAHTLAVSSKNLVTVTDPGADKLAVSLSGATGLMTGSFINPAIPGKKTPFKGVAQQKLNLAAGVFQGQAAAGGVILTPQ